MSSSMKWGGQVITSAGGARRPVGAGSLHARLSSREFQIFCKIAVGTGVSAIASELSLSVKTVSTYRARMMEKLAFHTNADVTAYAFRNALVR